MGKIKLNLVSGAVVEKPLINAFKANNNSYIVLDNEINGSMGLPIILVSKFENNKLIKIMDQNEWGIVKEYLKNIIAGNQIEFIKVDSELTADDIYYTQLTLPVPSFDALKNAYKIEENSSEVSEVSIMDIPTTEVAPNMNTFENVSAAEPVVSPVQNVVSSEPVAPQVETSIVNNNSAIDIPVAPQVNIAPEPAPIIEPVSVVASPMDIVPPVNDFNASVVEPAVAEINNTVIEDTTSIVGSNDSVFKEQKEAFMQACENMFDALVQKFERELDNRK